MTRQLSLRQIPGSFAVVRLPAGRALPMWTRRAASFSAIVRTEDELSIVFPEEKLPAEVPASREWACLRLEGGPFEFSEVGILASIAAPLATAGVGILAMSTHDTDYVLVRRDQLTAAQSALESTGHRVTLSAE